MDTEQATDVLAELNIYKAKLNTAMRFIDEVKSNRKSKNKKNNSKKKSSDYNELISEISNKKKDVIDVYDEFLDSNRYKRACKKFNVKENEGLDNDIEGKLFDAYMIDHDFEL